MDSLIALVIIGREITISALREWMAKVGRLGAASRWPSSASSTARRRCPAIPAALSRPRSGVRQPRLGTLLIYVAAVLTLWSMGYYMRCAWPELMKRSR